MSRRTSMWLLSLFFLSYDLGACELVFIDKHDGSVITNFSSWTPHPESCGNGVTSDYELVPSRFDFPSLGLLIEIIDNANAYTLSEGKVRQANGFDDMALVSNVSHISFDLFSKHLYYILDNTIMNFDGFVANITSSVRDFDVNDGHRLVLRDDGAVLLNDSLVTEATYDRLCFYPRDQQPLSFQEEIYYFILFPILLICAIPLVICFHPRMRPLARFLRPLLHRTSGDSESGGDARELPTLQP